MSRKGKGGSWGGTDPFGPWRMWSEMMRFQTEMTLAASEVVARRVHLFATGALTAEEATRMVMEKPAAMAKGMEAGARAFVAGASPHDAFMEAAEPISDRAQANARRLRR